MAIDEARQGVANARIGTWAEFYERLPSAADMLRWATTHAPMMSELLGCARILEVGTGSGMLSGMLALSSEVVVTVDNSGHILTGASRFFERISSPVHRTAGDAFELPFRDDAFDVAFSQGLLEHFDDDTVERMLREQLRIARVVLASVPSRFYPHFGRWGPGLIGNERLLTKRAWGRALASLHPELSYYHDYKMATFAGISVPWPGQMLIRITRAHGQQGSNGGGGRQPAAATTC